jgi:hypothetical protein
MVEKITVDLARGCPKCGNPALMVPEDTIVISPNCDYTALWKDVVGDGDEA